jgi:hypothetical protein
MGNVPVIDLCFSLECLITHAFCDRGSFDRKSLDRNCVFSIDQNFHNQLTEILDAFQLIESFNNEFDQTPKS